MMKIKKLLILTLAVLIAALALCACGNDDTGASVDSNGSVYDSYASSSNDAQDPEGESSGSSLNENYFQSSVML